MVKVQSVKVSCGSSAVPGTVSNNAYLVMLHYFHEDFFSPKNLLELTALPSVGMQNVCTGFQLRIHLFLVGCVVRN